MEPRLNLEYKISKDEWLSGYDIYHNLFRKKTVYLKAGIFLIPLILFIEQVIRDPSFTVGWVCIAICIAMIVSALMSVRFERKNMANALDAISDDKYVLNLFDDKFTVKTIVNESPENLEYGEDGELKPLPEIPESVCEFDTVLKACETSEIFALFSKKGSFFVPKTALDEVNKEVFKGTLVAALGERFFEK